MNKKKSHVYYNTEIAKTNLNSATDVFKQSLNKEQLRLFANCEELYKIYKSELIIEVFSFIFDYIRSKLELK